MVTFAIAPSPVPSGGQTPSTPMECPNGGSGAPTHHGMGALRGRMQTEAPPRRPSDPTYGRLLGEVGGACGDLGTLIPHLSAPGRSLAFVEREAHLERHLVAPDLPVLHLATHLGHLEPPDVADGGGRPGDRVLDGVGDAGARGPDKLDQLVDVLGHGWLSCAPLPNPGRRPPILGRPRGAAQPAAAPRSLPEPRAVRPGKPPPESLVALAPGASPAWKVTTPRAGR